MHDDLELTILMPCLDEAETLATCIGKARAYLEKSGVAGEVHDLGEESVADELRSVNSALAERHAH